MFKLSSLYAMLSAALGVNATPTRTYRNSRPTGAALRNPADPIQAARIEAAAVKRVRRALKLERDTEQSALRNNCINARLSNLNPFYVAK